MKVIFLGTPQLAVPSLTAISRRHQVLLVATQPDRPRGRGRHLGVPPVKVKARELGIPCWQPESLDTADERGTCRNKTGPDENRGDQAEN